MEEISDLASEDVRNSIVDMAIALDEISMLEHMCSVHGNKASCKKQDTGEHLEKYAKARERLLEVLVRM